MLAHRAVHSQVGAGADDDLPAERDSGAQRDVVLDDIVVGKTHVGHGDDMVADADVCGQDRAGEQNRSRAHRTASSHAGTGVDDRGVTVLLHPGLLQPGDDRAPRASLARTDHEVVIAEVSECGEPAYDACAVYFDPPECWIVVDQRDLVVAVKVTLDGQHLAREPTRRNEHQSRGHETSIRVRDGLVPAR